MMRRQRTRRRLGRGLAVLAPLLLLAVASPAHATYLRVFVGSQLWVPGVNVKTVETRIGRIEASGDVDRWLVQNRTLVASVPEGHALFQGNLEVARFGPLRLGDYRIHVILWDDASVDPCPPTHVFEGKCWRDRETLDTSIGILGGPDPLFWMPYPLSIPLPPLLDVTKTDALAVDVDGDGAVTVGDRVDYTVTVTNTSTETYGLIYEEVNDAVFQGQSFQEPPEATMTKPPDPPSTSAVTFALDPPGNIFSRRLTADIGSLDPGQYALVEFQVEVGQLGTLSRGYAQVDGEPGNPAFPAYPRIVVTDDPNVAGSEDPTPIYMSFAGPNLCRAQLPIALDNASDLDGDGIIRIDELAYGTNPDNSDTDFDGLDDALEIFGPDGVEGTGDETQATDEDTDGDGVDDGADNCVRVPNTDQTNADGDAHGDACDACPSLFDGKPSDLDRDGVPDVCDVCPLTHDPGQRDQFGFPSASPDGIGTACQTWDLTGEGRADGSDVGKMRVALAEAGPVPDPAMPSRGCAPGVLEQAFTPDMSGCEGAVAWADRSTLCAVGWYACTAAEWVAQRYGKVPTASYWTEDDLRYNGTLGACWVDESVGSPCNAGEPMRVCAGATDHLGNTCNWIDCGYGSAPPPNEYFGGCNGNTTAGTLCCR